jgi:hypothetical protein
MSKTMIAVALVGLVLGPAIVIVLAGQYRFRVLVDAERRSLLSSSAASVGPKQLQARWDGLPEPVRRYLQYAIREGAPAVRTAHLRHGGDFRTKPDDSWFAIKGEQHFTVAKPGFVWNASIWPAPVVSIDARDRLLSARGNMLVKLFSTFAIADASGAEIDQGAQLRWLGECAWFPYAYVGDDVQWEPIDARSARVTLRRDGLPVTAVVTIDDDGRLTELRAERYRDVGGGKSVLGRWNGRYSDYRQFNGFRVPTSVDVTWELEDGPFTYARFRVTALDYNGEQKKERRTEHTTPRAMSGPAKAGHYVT